MLATVCIPHVRRFLACFAAGFCLASGARGEGLAPVQIADGLATPESVAVGADGRIYVSEIGEFGKAGDGRISVVVDGKPQPFCTGLNDPKGLDAFREHLYVTDVDRVIRIDARGRPSVFVKTESFPRKPIFLNDLTVDPESGTIYVSDSGENGANSAVYVISPDGKPATLLDAQRFKELKGANGLALDGASHLLVLDFLSGKLFRVKLANRAVELAAEGFEGGDGLTFDRHGRLFISSWSQGKVWSIPRPGASAVLVSDRFHQSADTALDPTGALLLVPDMQAGTLSTLATAEVPGLEVDVKPFPAKVAPAFSDVVWTGWNPETPEGKILPFIPIVLTTDAVDSPRTFIATQHGVVHHLPTADARQSEILLDVSDRVRYDDRQNEEGFLGFAFHPRFAETGEAYAFYTRRNARHPHTNVVSRFRTRPGEKWKLDPASEEVVLTIEHPYWNHDGGTIAFGPDGFLYVALGDGGAANDPHEHGQNLATLLGAVLRIDVDKRDAGLNYAVPPDNPFVGRRGARGEIWAYGLRNVWRFSFDRKTGDCWAADVGQNLWEEINILRSGGNYGWNVREGLHPFGQKGVGPRPDLIDPIWEYHHNTGKSVTGGFVYRGKRIPGLGGHYLYADYVSGTIWALKYDFDAARVVANRPLADASKFPVLSFGEDGAGELYVLINSAAGKGVFRIEPAQD